MKIKSGRLSPLSAPLVGEVSVIWLNSLEFTLKFYFAVHLSEQQINDLIIKNHPRCQEEWLVNNAK